MSGTLSFVFRSHLHFHVCRYYDFAKKQGIPLPVLEKKGFIRYEGAECVVDCGVCSRLHSTMRRVHYSVVR